MLATLLLLPLWLAGCILSPLAQVNEPNRVGLLAPFEGLYRPNGYNALTSMRHVTDNDARLWLPVALDTSRGAQRAAQKLLAPRNISAIVGPLSPTEAADAYPALLGVDIRWLLPFAQVAGTPVAVDSPNWLASLIGEVASGPAVNLGISRIAIAGYAPILTIINKQDLVAQLAERVEMPVVWVDDPEAIQADDLLLWLGDAADGVRFIAQAREIQPQTPVWLPIWTVGDIFVSHANALPEWRWEDLMWGGWLPTDEASSANLVPIAAENALVEAATRHAIAFDSFTPGEWRFVTLPLLPK